MEYVKTYLYNLEQAIASNPVMFRSVYYDKEGCLKLAKEIGYGLADFTAEERNSIIWW